MAAGETRWRVDAVRNGVRLQTYYLPYIALASLDVPVEAGDKLYYRLEVEVSGIGFEDLLYPNTQVHTADQGVVAVFGYIQELH